MARRTEKLRLVIFDCDGVLVDSEGIANRVTAAAISRIGWHMTPDESDRHFLGMSLTDMMPVIEERLGHPVPAGWQEDMMADFLRELGAHVTAIPGAVDALDGLTAHGIKWRIASNSSHEEMRVKFARIGITARAAGRIHSFRDVPRAKPAPDLFLAAAAAEGVAPASCLVIEDSVVGVRAAIAAGMDCLGYAPHDDGERLAAAGAAPFRSMFDVPHLVGLAPRFADQRMTV